MNTRKYTIRLMTLEDRTAVYYMLDRSRGVYVRSNDEWLLPKESYVDMCGIGYMPPYDEGCDYVMDLRLTDAFPAYKPTAEGVWFIEPYGNFATKCKIMSKTYV